MILCASPDPKEMHKTISTLEYGAKAKCIVRAAHMSTPKEKTTSDESSTLLTSRIVAMNQFIYKLQMENKLREKERDDAQKELAKKEEELIEAKSKLKIIEGKSFLKEEEIRSKVEERTQMLRFELTKMEEKLLRQQEELGALRQQLGEMEQERGKVSEEALLQDIDGGRFVKRLSEIYAGDHGMEKSMELDTGDLTVIHDVKEIKEDFPQPEIYGNGLQLNPQGLDAEDEDHADMMRFPDRVCLSTVFERENEGDDKDSIEDYEVEKEVVEEKTRLDSENFMFTRDSELKCAENSKDATTARKTRIQNIFRLCGNYRELAHQVRVKTPSKTPEDGKNTRSSPFSVGKEPGKKEGLHESSVGDLRTNESPVSALFAPLALLHLADEQKPTKSQSFKKRVSPCGTPQELKENCKPEGQEGDGMMEVCVKWEASKEFTGNIIKKMKILKESTLSDLRKLIEVHLEEDNDKQSFSFLLLGVCYFTDAIYKLSFSSVFLSLAIELMWYLISWTLKMLIMRVTA